MTKMRHVSGTISRAVLCCGLLLATGAIDTTRGQARPTLLAVHTFYATSHDGYQQWCLQPAPRCVAPRRIAAFPTRTTAVAFYFATDYPATHATDMLAILPRVTIAVHTSAGTLFTAYRNLAADTLAFQTSKVSLGMGMAMIHAPQLRQDTTGSAYPDDLYRADLLLDGASIAHTAFSVGNGRPAPHAPAHSQVQAFYPTTEIAYSTWTDFGTVPAKALILQSSQAALYFYLRWSGVPASMPLRIGVLDLKRNALVAETGSFGVPHPSGYAMYIVRTPDRSPYGDGAYQARIISGDAVIARISFTIGG